MLSSKRMSKSVREAIGEKYPHVQIVEHESGEVEVDGRTLKVFCVFNFMICKSKVKRKS
jgi:hypothetical protein